MSTGGGDDRSPLRGRWVRFAIIVWAILAVISVGRAALAHNPRHAGCYAVFEAGGRHWLRGEDLYEKVQTNSLNVFRYAPTLAALLTPLAVTPLWVGNGLLRLVNLAVFLAGLWWWQRVTLPTSVTPRQRATFFLLVAAVGNNYLTDVQINVITAGLLLLTTAGATTGRWWVAAICVGLAVVLKAYPVSLALVLCVLAPRRFAWRYALAQLGWFALPFLLQNPEYVAGQYRDWLKYGLNARFVEGWFVDVMYLAGRFGVGMTRAEYWALSAAAAGCVAGLVLLHRNRGDWTREVNTAYGMCVGWMLAFGPSSEQVTYILAAPAVAGSLFLAWHRPNPRWFRAVLTAAAFLLAGTQFELLFPGPHRFKLYGAHPAAMVLYLLAVGRQGFGHPTARPEPAAEASAPPFRRAA
jgi:hypothetical protein